MQGCIGRIHSLEVAEMVGSKMMSFLELSEVGCVVMTMVERGCCVITRLVDWEDWWWVGEGLGLESG